MSTQDFIRMIDLIRELNKSDSQNAGLIINELGKLESLIHILFSRGIISKQELDSIYHNGNFLEQKFYNDMKKIRKGEGGDSLTK